MATSQNDVVHYISASCLTDYKKISSIVINMYVCMHNIISKFHIFLNSIFNAGYGVKVQKMSI
jgi:hypothetical protein